MNTLYWLNPTGDITEFAGYECRKLKHNLKSNENKNNSAIKIALSKK